MEWELIVCEQDPPKLRLQSFMERQQSILRPVEWVGVAAHGVQQHATGPDICLLHTTAQQAGK